MDDDSVDAFQCFHLYVAADHHEDVWTLCLHAFVLCLPSCHQWTHRLRCFLMEAVWGEFNNNGSKGVVWLVDFGPADADHPPVEEKRCHTHRSGFSGTFPFLNNSHWFLEKLFVSLLFPSLTSLTDLSNIPCLWFSFLFKATEDQKCFDFICIVAVIETAPSSHASSRCWGGSLFEHHSRIYSLSFLSRLIGEKWGRA